MCLPGKVHTTPTFFPLFCPGPENRPNGDSVPCSGIWTQSAASLGVRFSGPLFHIAQLLPHLFIRSHLPLPSLPHCAAGRGSQLLVVRTGLVALGQLHHRP